MTQKVTPPVPADVVWLAWSSAPVPVLGAVLGHLSWHKILVLYVVCCTSHLSAHLSTIFSCCSCPTVVGEGWSRVYNSPSQPLVRDEIGECVTAAAPGRRGRAATRPGPAAPRREAQPTCKGDTGRARGPSSRGQPHPLGRRQPGGGSNDSRARPGTRGTSGELWVVSAGGPQLSLPVAVAGRLRARRRRAGGAARRWSRTP